MKARLKFSKAGSMKFIGHLDVMRYFQKAFRRSGLPISYSQGFNPHPLMSFAQPLGVGLTSDGEYLDIRLESDPGPDVLLQRLNAQMNEEIRITGYTPLPDSAKPSMSVVACADYLISLKDGYTSPTDIRERFEAFLGQNSIVVTKESKKSRQETDIRPDIYAWAFSGEAFRARGGCIPEASVAARYENGCRFFLKLAQGSVRNLKPDLVLEAFYQWLEEEYRAPAWQLHRLELYAGGKPENGFIPLSKAVSEAQGEKYGKQIDTY